MTTFDGKVAAITGAASGIGRALAQALAAQRCALALADVDEVGLAETERLTGGRARVTTARVDVAQRAEVEAWAARVVAEHGRVHLVVNNAGVALGDRAETSSADDFAWLMGVNFWGVVHGTQAFLPHLRAAGEGHIVNVSSVFGLVAFPGNAAYNASKFAVRGFTEALGIELDIEGVSIGVTCVHPGGIKTAIARSARSRPGLAALGVEPDQAHHFEKLFRTTPERAAQVILDAVSRGERRVLIGADAHVIDVLQRLFPVVYQRFLAAAGRMRLRR